MRVTRRKWWKSPKKAKELVSGRVFRRRSHDAANDDLEHGVSVRWVASLDKEDPPQNTRNRSVIYQAGCYVTDTPLDPHEEGAQEKRREGKGCGWQECAFKLLKMLQLPGHEQTKGHHCSSSCQCC